MITVNKELALPNWPKLKVEKKTKDCVIQVKHMTFRRLRFMRSLVNLCLWMIIAAMFYGVYEDVMNYPLNPDLEGLLFKALLRTIYAVIILRLAAFFSIAQLPAWMFLRKKTTIRFTGDTLRVNNRSYTIDPRHPIQFRANRPYLDEEHHTRLRQRVFFGSRSGIDGLLFKFRRVEMIRGSAIEPIAIIADQSRAEQFAVVLQAALAWNREHGTQKGKRSISRSIEKEIGLPIGMAPAEELPE